MTERRAIGEYHVLAQLGEGGMALVYLVVCEGRTGGSDEFYVLKMLRPHLSDDRDARAMLRDEAKLATRLKHPNIVTTYALEMFRNEPLLRMEYLDGQTLGRAVHREGKSMPLPMKLHAICEVLSGLEYAHRQRDDRGIRLNLIHRDMSPHNVLVTYGGQVKLVDFGIAKAEGREHATRHGVVKGKLGYMSPEQSRASAIDARSDIFGVGIMLFEMTTGKRLWADVPDRELARRLARGQHQRSARALAPNLAPELDEIIGRALEPDPKNRFQTADEMRAALLRYCESELPPVTPEMLGSYVSDVFSDRRTRAHAIIAKELESWRRQQSKVPQRSEPTIKLELGELLADDLSEEQPTQVRSTASVGAPAPAPVLRPTLSSAPPPAPAQVETVSPKPRPPATRPVTLRSALAPPAPRLSGRTGTYVLQGLKVVSVLLAGAAMLGWYWLSFRVRQAPTIEGAGTSASASTGEVSLRVTASPSNATVLLDGKPVSHPLNLRLPRGGAAHRVEVSAPGFLPHTEEVDARTDTTLQITLGP